MHTGDSGIVSSCSVIKPFSVLGPDVGKLHRRDLFKLRMVIEPSTKKEPSPCFVMSGLLDAE